MQVVLKATHSISCRHTLRNEISYRVELGNTTLCRAIPLTDNTEMYNQFTGEYNLRFKTESAIQNSSTRESHEITSISGNGGRALNLRMACKAAFGG
jgi:hypothetical protein